MRLFDNRLGPDGVDIAVLGRIAFTVPYGTIVECEVIWPFRLWQLGGGFFDPLRTLRLPSRIQAKGVAIRTSTGFIRVYVITPPDPEKFVEKLRGRAEIARKAAATRWAKD